MIRRFTTETQRLRGRTEGAQRLRISFRFRRLSVSLCLCGEFRPLLALVLALVPLTAGCTRDGHFQAISMWNESRLKPLEEGPQAGEQSSSFPLAPGSIARGELPPDDPLATGMSGGKLVTKIPLTVTRAVLEHGQSRFNIYCIPCHGREGNGEGMIVKRGFPHPPDYKIARLVHAPVGHFFDVITHGYGVMYPYASRVPVRDRWAIAAYIRVLQQLPRPVIPESEYAAQRRAGRASGIGARPVRSE
jgi:mono/diheme cytochrome c family protein